MMAIADQLNNIRSLSQQLYERDNATAQEHRRLKAFNSIIVKANESTSQKELVQSILDACLNVVNFDLGGIYLIKDGKSSIVTTKFVPPESIEILNSICTARPELVELLKFGKPVYVRDYHMLYPETSILLGGITTFIAVPILYNGKIKGCINIGAFNDVVISSDDCDIIRTLGKHLGHILYWVEVEQEIESKVIDLEAYAQELRASTEELHNAVARSEKAQQHLDMERQNFTNLFNKITDMIFVISTNGKIISINDAVRHRLGYPNGQLIGQNVGIVYDPSNCASTALMMEDLARDDRWKHNSVLVSKTGEFIHVDTRVVKGMWGGIEVLYNVSREV